MGFAAGHGRDTLRAKLLGDWEGLVAQGPTTVNQRHLAGEPDGQPDRTGPLAAATTGPATSATWSRKPARRTRLRVPALSPLASNDSVAGTTRRHGFP